MGGEFPQKVGLTARHFLVLSDVISLCLSFYLSYRLLPFYRPYLRSEQFTLPPFATYFWLLLLIVPLWYLLSERSGLYAQMRLAWEFVFRNTVRVQILGLAVLSVFIFVLKLQTISRLMTFGFCALYVPVSMVLRWLTLLLLEAHRSHMYNVPRILVIGSGERAKEFIRRAKKAEEIRFEFVGCMEPDSALAHGQVEGVPVLGTTENFGQYIFEHPVDIVVFALPVDRVPNANSLIKTAIELGLRVLVVPDFYLQRVGYGFSDSEVSLDSFLGMPVAVFSNVPRRTTYIFLKRIMDIMISAALLVLLTPLLALIAGLVKLTSPGGPVFYRWRVLGINKKPLVSYKFRTMVPNADDLKSQLLDYNEMQGPVFKIRGDPRITPLGRFLRKYSLDELPQLYSVLKGDVSLVGPRPPFKEEADRFQLWQRRKLSVKPGITCLWQVNGRNEINSFDEWARLDLEYIQNASLWLDLKILLRTIPVVLRGRGAY